MGPKTEKDLLPKVSRQKREFVSREVLRERSVLDGMVKKVRKVRWHGVMTETLKTVQIVSFICSFHTGVAARTLVKHIEVNKGVAGTFSNQPANKRPLRYSCEGE